MPKNILFFIIFTTLTNSIIYSSEDYTIKLLKDEIKNIQLEKKCYYFEDESLLFDVNDVKQMPLSVFNKVESCNINFGFTKSAYWLRYTLKNLSDDDVTLAYSINYPLINYISYYEAINDSIIRESQVGELVPFRERDIANRNFLFRVHLDTGQEKTIYTRIYNNGETIRASISLEKEDVFMSKDARDFGVKFFYYGFILFAILFNIFMFVTIGDRTYLYFFLYVIFLGLFLFNVDGFSYSFFWQGCPWWANHSTVIFVGLASAFLLLFTKSFLKVKEYFPPVNIILNILLVIVGLFVLSAFLNYPWYAFIVKGINYLSVFNVVIVILISVLAMRKRFFQAKIFLSSFIVLLIGVLFYVLRNAGIVPVNMLTQYGVKLGFGIQILFLCFAVSDRFKKAMEYANQRLEQMVEERTEQIRKQKEELETQRDFVSQQKEKIDKQNKDIIKSIKYAKRIQSAMLPSTTFTNNLFSDSFNFFMPRDIVSGDFYWINRKNNRTIVVVADCTGHGVPGAFMSMLGVSFLNEIVNRILIYHKDIKANEILNELSNYVIGTLAFTPGKEKIQDGMDMALCIFDHDRSLIHFAGAHRPLYIMRNGELIEIKGDRLSVGYNIGKVASFNDHIVEYKENDVIYLFTDGYVDQISDETRKTFRTGRFKKLLKEIHDEPLSEQKVMLYNTYNEWKGDYDQIDDILVMGIKI
jgi:serine phosphatase RsbU (regulator of sigma subunit)